MLTNSLWQLHLPTTRVPASFIQSCRLFGGNTAKGKATDPPDKTNRDHEKLIKIAIVGVPNAGKSTFINNLINHRVSNPKSIHPSTNIYEVMLQQSAFFRFAQLPAKFIQLVHSQKR